ACDWLQRKRWGTSPDGPLDLVHTGDWSYNPSTTSNSTRRLLASFASEVGSRDLQSTSTDERLRILAAEPAWHRLCPASQWIRRPAGFSGGD
ncbi:MAG: hypothetical protein M3Q87_00465, partial [Actinomycetota bacterium]|nr:hypothetical protein [Actinomycetota bacterium]